MSRDYSESYLSHLNFVFNCTLELKESFSHIPREPGCRAVRSWGLVP
jgi:hypothetical protein